MAFLSYQKHKVSVILVIPSVTEKVFCSLLFVLNLYINHPRVRLSFCSFLVCPKYDYQFQNNS